MVERIPYDKLEIATGWLLADLKTTDDCDEATLHLTREIASIENQLEEFDEETTDGAATAPDDSQWQRKARAALKIKNVLRGLVEKRRRDIVRASGVATP